METTVIQGTTKFEIVEGQGKNGKPYKFLVVYFGEYKKRCGFIDSKEQFIINTIIKK